MSYRNTRSDDKKKSAGGPTRQRQLSADPQVGIQKRSPEQTEQYIDIPLFPKRRGFALISVSVFPFHHHTRKQGDMRQFIKIIGALIMTATPVASQTCTELCDPDWWETASNANIVQMIAQSDVNGRDEYEELTPLSTVAVYGNAALIKLLLDAGANVDMVANAYNGTTALHDAALWAETPDTLSALINAGADVNARDGGQATALMQAAARAQTGFVAPLLEAGADIELQDEYGYTALLNGAVAVGSASANLVALLNAGANVNVQNEDGKTPLIAAYSRPDIVILLLDAGANPMLQDRYGKTAYDWAKDFEPLAGSEALSRLRAATTP